MRYIGSRWKPRDTSAGIIWLICERCGSLGPRIDGHCGSSVIRARCCRAVECQRPGFGDFDERPTQDESPSRGGSLEFVH